MSASPLIQTTSTPIQKLGPTQQRLYDRAIEIFKSCETDLDKVKHNLWFDNMARIDKAPVNKIVDLAWANYSATLTQPTDLTAISSPVENEESLDDLFVSLDEITTKPFDPLPLVPAIFKTYSNWVTWESLENKGPRISGTDQNAKSNEPSTWVGYQAACDNITAGRGFKNLGFVTNGKQTDNLTGIDIDGCRNLATGEISEWGLQIVKLCDSYCEVTPSGAGLRIWVIAELVDDYVKVSHLALSVGYGSKVQVEIYNDGKYFTICGQRLDISSHDIKTLGTKKLVDLFNLLDDLRKQYPPTDEQRREEVKKHHRMRSVQNPDGSLSFVPVPPDDGFKRLFDAVGWTPFAKRLERMEDIRFHNPTLEPGRLMFCPMPGHGSRGVDVKYTSLIFGVVAGCEQIAHCFGCGWSGDMVKACRDFDGGLEGGKIEYATMYDCARKICQEEGLKFEDYFPSSQVATAQEKQDENENTEIKEESLPDFPRLTGSLAELADIICPDIPREFKIMAAITHFGLIRSGLDVLENEEHLQPRFYTCFIKEPGWGKTAAINEIRRVMQMISSDYVTDSSIDSAPSLVDEFKELVDEFKDRETLRSLRDMRRQDDADRDGDHLPLKDDGLHLANYAKVLLDPDEMKDLFEKTKVTSNSRNSMMTELLKLYETNRTGNRARSTRKGKIEVNNAHLAILGGAVRDGYEAMWVGTGGGALGMQSRMVLVTTNVGKMPIEKTPTDYARLEEILPRLKKQADQCRRVVKVSPEARRMLRTWWESETRGTPADSRVDDMVKRMAIVLAITNDVDTVDASLMTQAIQFGDYQIAIRQEFNSPDSYSWVQSFELAIVKVAKKRKIAMTQNEFQKYVNATHKPDGLDSFLKAWRNVLMAGLLQQDGKTHKGTFKYRY